MRIVIASIAGYVFAALFNAILVVAKETNENIESWLKITFGHHWIGHGILVILSFVLVTLLVYFAYSKKVELEEKTITKLTILTLIVTLLSVIIIAGFFASHL